MVYDCVQSATTSGPPADPSGPSSSQVHPVLGMYCSVAPTNATEGPLQPHHGPLPPSRVEQIAGPSRPGMSPSIAPASAMESPSQPPLDLPPSRDGGTSHPVRFWACPRPDIADSSRPQCPPQPHNGPLPTLSGPGSSSVHPVLRCTARSLQPTRPRVRLNHNTVPRRPSGSSRSLAHPVLR